MKKSCFFLLFLIALFLAQHMDAYAAEQAAFLLALSTERTDSSELPQKTRSDELAGSYRLMSIDGRPYDPDSVVDSVLFFGNLKIFTLEQIENRWVVFGEIKNEGWPMWNYDVEDRLDEKFTKKLGNEKLLNAPCLDSGGASRMRICAIAPGETLNWRDCEYAISTGYFAFNGDHLILLEKLR